MKYGGFYEDFLPGAAHRRWPGRTVGECDNTLLALLSMNPNPWFLDHAYATSPPLGRRPAIDTLAFSLKVGTSVADMTGKAIANLGCDSIVFGRPLSPGDSLYPEVLEKRESASKADRGIVAIDTRAFNQNRERILVFRRRRLVPKRGGS